MKDIMIIQKDLKFFQMKNENNAYNICIIKILNIYLICLNGKNNYYNLIIGLFLHYKFY